jgi:RNA binding exosome subunit
LSLLVNKLTIDVFQHATEEKNKIFLGLNNLFPVDFHTEMEKMFKEENLTGYHKNEIIKYNVELPKKKETQNISLFILKKILVSCSLYELLERITEDGELFIRLNKQDLIRGEFTLDLSSDVYKICMKFLFFNKKINKIEKINEFLQNLSSE